MPDEVMAYCRRCDLAFCEAHLHEHQWFEMYNSHPEPVPRPNVLFCSVCVGIYKPEARAHVQNY